MSTQTQVPSANQVQNLVKTYTNAIFCGIQMLGFDFQAHEKQHKLTFNAQLFAKPNSKAFEIIVHFLLCQLDTDRAQKLFSQCLLTFCCSCCCCYSFLTIYVCV